MKVSETFMSMQGEGVSQGVPAYFIRMSDCNLRCKWCDTADKIEEGFDIPNQELERRIEEEGQLQRVLRGETHLIWTGGEPMLNHHQAEIWEFGKYLVDKYKVTSLYQEVETNGTRFISDELFSQIRQINCSPKLESSGMPAARRINKSVIEQVKKHTNGWFKFVVGGEKDVVEMVETYLKPFDVPKSRVILMPNVTHPNQLAERTKKAYELGMRYGYRVSTRTHLLAGVR